MSDSATSTTVPAWYETYLWLPRRNAPVTFEDFLSRWAEQGYLVIGVAEDVASHGDAQFLQARRAPKPRQTAALYWQQHAALHEQLCAMGLRHMPVGLGPEPGEPFAIAWLLPAPAKGKLYAPAGFEQTVKLSPEQRNDWLDWVAREVLATGGPAQRVLLQPPGAQPACWNYGPYRGDAPLDGPHTERLRTLLAALPRLRHYHPSAGPNAGRSRYLATSVESAGERNYRRNTLGARPPGAVSNQHARGEDLLAE